MPDLRSELALGQGNSRAEVGNRHGDFLYYTSFIYGLAVHIVAKDFTFLDFYPKA